MSHTAHRTAATAGEVFAAFLKLGLTSFGGPIAHIGYFQRELVERRGWIGDDSFAQLVALCQLLPGPASSKLGFALGLIRAGWAGAFAAFIAFTLPSALLLFAFSHALPYLERPLGSAAIHGLKVLAVAVVAHGLLGMARHLTPDIPRMLIAAVAASLVLLASTAAMQIGVIVLGAALGLVFLRRVSVATPGVLPLRYSTGTGAVLLLVFGLLLLLSFALQGSMMAAFYRAGALVFGGGHVVLPLLQEGLVEPGWISSDTFFAGYGAAQAVPGPLFSVAAFLGAQAQGARGGAVGAVGAALALLAIFLPGFLLIAGALPFWGRIVASPAALRAIAGVNAAVVGLLAAALYDPIWISAVLTAADFAVAAAGFVLLAATRVSVLWVLLLCVLASLVRPMLS